MAFAKVMIIGNLGRDPEMRYTPNGRPVTEFSVAVSHRSRDAQTGEWSDDQTDWYRVTVWGDRAERTAEQFRKGNRVFVEGRFRTREYEARDGQKRVSLEITADNVIAFGERARDEEGSFGAPAGGFGGGAGSGGGSGGDSGGGDVRPTRAPQPPPPQLDGHPL
jgi:single-strand DNA-binding protein